MSLNQPPGQVNPLYVEQLRELVADAPYPHHMAMTLDAISIDGCQVRIEIDQRHFQPYGIVHGGVIATIIDTATFWAAFLRLPQDIGLVNIDLKLNYLKAVTAGPLVATGTCIRPGRRVSYCEAKVHNADNQLIAHGTSSLLTLENQQLPIRERKWLR